MKTVLTLMAMIATVTSCYSTPTENSNTEIMNEKDILNAVKNNDIQAVRKALENGADVNTTDNSRRSLLLIATNKTNIEMAKLLVKYGADVNQQADNLDSPFLYAGASGQTELVQLFLNHGARFDVFNRYNGSALIPACERGHIETVKLLANTKDYPIDHVNRLGWTGLMEAIILGDGSKKYQQIVQILKDAGAKMDIPDRDGITPLQHAQQRGYKEIVTIIKS
ncbi:ankyrin repeat domain-containing protein [Empedobacter brevis]|uniref:ankyrin repeat domain-containing protein n=1 Tax=Empedobacter brevis TaxID=247 RepID=UPI0033407D44